MRRTAMLAAWFAIGIGLIQILIACNGLFGGGWAMILFTGMILLPFLPIVLTQEVRPWGRPPPAVPLAAALLSISVSAGFYWLLYNHLD